MGHAALKESGVPGGSGLFEQLTSRWEEDSFSSAGPVRRYPGACATSCIDCLRTYRDRFYHEHLNRHVALVAFGSAGHLSERAICPSAADGSTTGRPVSIEARFSASSAAAGTAGPAVPIPCRSSAPVTAPRSLTFFYEGDDADEARRLYLPRRRRRARSRRPSTGRRGPRPAGEFEPG